MSRTKEPPIPVRRAVVVVAVSALFVAPACTDDPTVADPPVEGSLEGVTWVLDRSSVEALAAEVPDDARADIRFDAADVSGQAGCNGYFGTYTVDGSSLTLSGLGATEMACEPASLMELETSFLTALAEVDAFEVTEARLALRGGEVELTFSPERPPTPLPLVGTRWELLSLGYGDEAVSSPIAGAEPWISFRDDGSAEGSTGCNRFGTTYQVDGDAIAIGADMRITLKACEPDVGQQEDVFQRGLLRAARYSISGDILSLSDAEGVWLMDLRGSAADAG